MWDTNIIPIQCKRVGGAISLLFDNCMYFQKKEKKQKQPDIADHLIDLREQLDNVELKVTD